MRLLVAVLGSLLLLTSCGSDPLSGGRSQTPFELPVGDPTYDATQPAWQIGGTIHVGDDTIEVDPEPSSFVVASGGVYYLSGQALYFSDGGAVQKVAQVGSSRQLRMSSDGRYLGLLDQAHGRTDRYDTTVAVPVVFALDDGRQVLRGAGDYSLEGQDLADLYEDAELSFDGFVGDDVVITDPLAPTELTRYRLDGSEPTPIEVDPQSGRHELKGLIQTERGFRGGLTAGPRRLWKANDFFSPDIGWLSPGREVALAWNVIAPPRFYDARTGEPTSFDPGAPTFRLGGWVDDRTFFGAALGRGGRASGNIVTCSIRTAKCRSVGDLTAVGPEDVRFPEDGLF